MYQSLYCFFFSLNYTSFGFHNWLICHLIIELSRKSPHFWFDITLLYKLLKKEVYFTFSSDFMQISFSCWIKLNTFVQWIYRVCLGSPWAGRYHKKLWASWCYRMVSPWRKTFFYSVIFMSALAVLFWT